MLRLAGIFLSYALGIGVLCAGLIGGVMWLVQPGAAVSHEARAAPIPPRIAESIERKKPIIVHESAPEPVKPAMTEANVSLTPASAPSFKIRELTPPAKPKRRPRGDQGVAQAMPAEAPRAAPVVTTARSDVPY